jgi:hypothetical protein
LLLFAAAPASAASVAGTLCFNLTLTRLDGRNT